MIEEIKLASGFRVLLRMVKPGLPLRIFFPGTGETVDGGSGGNINALRTWGPFSFLDKSWFPDNMNDAAVFNNKWMAPASLDHIVLDLMHHTKASSVHATGLSLGGAFWLQQMLLSPVAAARISSAVLMSNPIPGDTVATTAAIAGMKHVKYWGIHAANDTKVFYNPHKAFFNKLVAQGNETAWTDYAGYHSGWNTFYNPDWKQGGVGIYDFMDKAAGGSAPVEPKVKKIIEVYDNGETVEKVIA